MQIFDILRHFQTKPIYINFIKLPIMRKNIKSLCINALKKKTYIAPDIEVIEIEIEQNILSNGSTRDLPGFAPSDW